jgi:hypothetical protein
MASGGVKFEKKIKIFEKSNNVGNRPKSAQNQKI